MTGLADAVLPLIRTRADVWRRGVANEHGTRMHEAVAVLKDAADDGDPDDVFAVTQRAIASALTVIMRADDSSGIIGDACRNLVALHPIVAAKARPATAKLIDWMLKFQFDGKCDYFTLDPVAYAPALGADGMASYRARICERATELGSRPAQDERWFGPDSHAWFTIDWNAQRLAVFDRDIAAIIATHAKDRLVAAWLHDTAVALMEIGEADLAIDWAKQAADFNSGHQSQGAAEYWCELLAAHRPSELPAARAEVFDRWPSSATAGRLYADAGDAWQDYRDEVMQRLSPSPREVVLFALLPLNDVALAWNLAHSLGLTDAGTWSELGASYEKLDPAAVLPVYTELVERELEATGAKVLPQCRPAAQ